MPLVPYLQRAIAREDLASEDAQQAMSIILGGRAPNTQIAGFLIALRMKGETASELIGFARAMRAASSRVMLEDTEPLLDTCGTGGDGHGTFNISTISAFVVAAAGVRVAKHGNRSISSLCGSADVIERFGIRVAMGTEEAARAIREVGIAFLFAPAFHPAMKNANPVRVELKTRTVFNLLGPLTNPAGATAQIVGAPSPDAAALIAEALAALGLARGFVVHGSDGMDEITTTGPTLAFAIENGRASRCTLTPDQFGVPTASLADLKGGPPAVNHEIAIAILRGARGPKRDIVLVNSSAALVAAGRVADFTEGIALAADLIDSGAALKKVEELASFTQSA